MFSKDGPISRLPNIIARGAFIVSGDPDDAAVVLQNEFVKRLPAFIGQGEILFPAVLRNLTP